MRGAKMRRLPTNKLFEQQLLLHFLWIFLFFYGCKAAPKIDLCSSEEGGLAQMDDRNMPKQCASDVDCFPPANCHYSHKICCIFPLNQETPPIGCPKGTRQLRNSKGDWLSCKPTKPGSCPGGAICYEDTLEPEQFRCCGKDPGEGCGIGQRVLRHANGSSHLCVPGDGSECVGNAVCEWSFAIDRFQCCEPDNGCIGMENPLFDSSNDVLSCSPAHSEPCPDGATCRFNFWTASFQCCTQPKSSSETIESIASKTRDKSVVAGKSLETLATSSSPLPTPKECPAGEIAYSLEPSFNLDLSSDNSCSSDVDCPPMAHCHSRSRICCGPPGECPRPAEHPIYDEQGHIRLCSLHQPELCPADSKCRETVDPFSGLSTGQRVCCSAFSFQCAASGTPFPNEENPLRCELDNPITCPLDMLCQASNLPDVSICCRSAADSSPEFAGKSLRQRRNLCPRGWLPFGHLNIFCHPTMHGSCPGRSACILSPHSGQFVCCQPIGRKMMAADDTLNPAAGRQLKRSDAFALSCPNPDDAIDTVRGGYPRQCTIDKRIGCRKGFLCEPSIENPLLGVCCSEKRTRSTARQGGLSKILMQRQQIRDPSITQSHHGSPLYRCPTADQLPLVQHGQNVFCDVPGQCPAASSCQSALNSFAMMICCRNARQNTPVCPEGMHAEQSPIGYVLCELLQPNQCSEGFQCVHSRDDPEQSICCAKLRNARPAAVQYICPNQQVLYRDGPGPRFCQPNAQSGCPRGYSCEEALGQPGIFVCCSVPAQPVCPAGFDASLDLLRGNPIYCFPADQSMCPADADCMPAENRANTFLCCISREPGRICPQLGQHALLQPNGQPEQCSGPGAPCSKPTYSCQLSYTLNNRYVCCGPPGAHILCADGRETYQQELGKTARCNPISLYSECPAGFECALSNVPNAHVCCRRMEAPQPTPQAPTDLPIPLGPIPAATFRPPVDELSCPIGWSAYEDQKGAHHFCQDALDMTCPHGFSCAQSSVNGIFMCCRLASSIQCPQAYSTLMLNNNPRLCSIGARQIGGNGQNAISNLGGSTSIGGGTTNSLGGVSSSASTMPAVNACPAGYTCMQSSVPAVYVCCGGNTNFPGSVPLLPGQYGTRGGDALYCSDGQIPAYLGQFVRFCSSIGQNTECPPSYLCAQSTRPGFLVCCHPFPMIRRRSSSPPLGLFADDFHQNSSVSICGHGFTVALEPSKGEPMECRELTTEQGENGGVRECPENFQCQPSLTNSKMYCCRNNNKIAVLPNEEEQKKMICSDSGQPYRSPIIGDLVLCGQTALNGAKCPKGFDCRPSPALQGVQVCCSTKP